MAKGKGRRIQASRPGGRPDIRQQIMRLQEQMLQTQESLGEETVTATAGGGVVKVVVTGQQRVQAITIDPEVVNPDDVEMLQDLIVAAVNEALDRSRTVAAERLAALTGGLGGLGGLEGLSGLLG